MRDTERRLATPEDFIELLEQAGVESPDGLLMETISRTPALSILMMTCRTSADALNVLDLASTVLHSHTKAVVLQQAGVVVDGVMPVEGVQSAMFFYAFKNCAPHVLKVLTRQQNAKEECKLWHDVHEHTRGAGVYCVPVTPLDLRGEHTVLLAGGGADEMPLRSAILMPRYACTLSNIPRPMDACWALRVLARMSASLRAVHAAGWVHGDVKPSNIFIDFAGDAWLGDYGSSCRIAAVDSYTGGTPAFQCSDISVQEHARFDRACLAVTLCCVMDVLHHNKSRSAVRPVSWSAATLHAAVAALSDAPLKAALEELLMDPQESAS